LKTKIVILGAGESGVGAAMLAKAKGFDVFVSDFGEIKPQYRQILQNENIAFEEGKHTEEVILSSTEVIKSPGIPDKAPIIKQLHERKIPVISEIEFAGRYLKGKTICITGSNGKTTTTLLTFHILKKAGYNVALAGNVGHSLAQLAIEDKYDYYVVELSSFQLDGMFNFKADVAVLMNITPDHLDRYEYDFQNYIDSKFRIIQNQTESDKFIYFVDDEVVFKNLISKETVSKLMPFSRVRKNISQGAFINDNSLIFKYETQEYKIETNKLSLKGLHNASNAMAAALAVLSVGVEWKFIEAGLNDFPPVEHRLEFVAEINGIEYINDSKATNTDSVFYALESMTKPTVWIVGGVDKGNDYSTLHEFVSKKVKAIVCMGKDNTKLLKVFENQKPIAEAFSMSEAISKATEFAQSGDCVLLSPACASFDLFQNYEDRGRQFKQFVTNMITKC